MGQRYKQTIESALPNQGRVQPYLGLVIMTCRLLGKLTFLDLTPLGLAMAFLVFLCPLLTPRRVRRSPSAFRSPLLLPPPPPPPNCHSSSKVSSGLLLFSVLFSSSSSSASSFLQSSCFSTFLPSSPLAAANVFFVCRFFAGLVAFSSGAGFSFSTGVSSTKKFSGSLGASLGEKEN